MGDTDGEEVECVNNNFGMVEKIIVAAGTVIVGFYNATPVGGDSGQVWKVLFVSSSEPYI